MKRGIIYFAVIFVLGSFSLNANAQSVDLAPYFNLTEGRTLVYQRYDCSGPAGCVLDTTYSTFVASLAGSFGPSFKGHIRFDLAGAPTDMDIWNLEADGHHFAGEYDFPTTRLNTADPFPGPVDGTMTVGVPAVFNFDEYEDGVFQGTASVEETFFGISSLSVPAGTFNDSALIVINMSKDGVLSETSLWVWANGVGPIFEFNFLPDGTPDDLIILVAIVP